MAAVQYSIKLTPKFPESSKTNSLPVIALNTIDNKEVILGRSSITGITDKRCSRDHTKLKLDERSEEIVFHQLGSNPSCVVYKNKDTVLSKHDVKRLPLAPLTLAASESCSLYLIRRDLLYGYELDVKREDSNVISTTSTPTTISNNGSGSKKRHATLDTFVVKKPKPDSDNKAEDTTITQKGSWTEVDRLIFLYNHEGLNGSSKIAGFDMDGTLITTASGAKWPKDKDDWKFLVPSVPVKLRALHNDGYKIVIFTNQGGIANGTLKPAVIQQKIEAIIQKVAVPMQAMIAGSKRGKFRKPLTGMWTYICTEENNGVIADAASCFYVGDAAGRIANWRPGKKKDFSNSDRLFALNAGIKFVTPEPFFNGEKEGAFEMPEFNPVKAMDVKNLLEPGSANLRTGSQELIVMVGFPGSGKSCFSTKHLGDYQHINRDMLGSWQKCVAKCEQELSRGKSVVIDNTNPDTESRARYVEVAKKCKVPVRCFIMSTSYKQARHNEVYRQLTNSKHKPINDMVVNSYKSKYTEPSLSEGFTELVKVNVVLEFDNNDQRKLYSQYLLEK